MRQNDKGTPGKPASYAFDRDEKCNAKGFTNLLALVASKVGLLAAASSDQKEDNMNTHAARYDSKPLTFGSMVVNNAKQTVDGKTLLRRAREALGFALLGAVVAGAITAALGGHTQSEMIQLIGALGAIVSAKTLNLI